MNPGYESFFGLPERPFSLTQDPRFFFKSRSHARAAETLTFGLRGSDRFVVVTGDLGVGKTMICRTLVEQLRRRVPVSYVANPLMPAALFERLLTEDFGVESLQDLSAHHAEAVIIVDEAHTMPPSLLEQLLTLAFGRRYGHTAMRFAFVGQASPGEPTRLGIEELDDHVTTRVRLLPLGREECAAYIEHRLHVASPEHRVVFSARAYDYVFALSGGVPRLINLLCERALQEAAAAGGHHIEPATIDMAAATLQLLRARPRRFRWYTTRVS